MKHNAKQLEFDFGSSYSSYEDPIRNIMAKVWGKEFDEKFREMLPELLSHYKVNH